MGHEDGENYAYPNTRNNRKLLDVVTYDREGNPIPLSKRLNKMHPSVSFFIRDMTQAARVMLLRREDDLEGEELIARWDELPERLETARVFVCALEAAQSVQPSERRKGSHFDRFGMRAVIAENSPSENALITGFIITPNTIRKGQVKLRLPTPAHSPTHSMNWPVLKKWLLPFPLLYRVSMPLSSKILKLGVLHHTCPKV